MAQGIDQFDPDTAELVFDPGRAVKARTSAGDVAKSLGAGAVDALGYAIRGISNLGAQAINRGVERLTGHNPLLTGGNPLESISKGLRDSRTEGGKLAQELSTPSGSIDDLNSISLGAAPSVGGYLQNLGDVVGQFAAPAAVALATRRLSPAAAAGVGAVQGIATSGGAAAQQAEDTIAALSDAELEQQSSQYRDYLAAGFSPTEARQRTSLDAELGAGTIGAIPAALEGAVLPALLQGRLKLPALGGGKPAQIAGGALVGGLGESAQEVAEGIAGQYGMNVGAGMEAPLLEGSVANAVLGFGGGAVAGGGIKALEGPRSKDESVVDPVATQRAAAQTVDREQQRAADIADVAAAAQAPDAGPLTRAVGGNPDATAAAAPPVDLKAEFSELQQRQAQEEKDKAGIEQGFAEFERAVTQERMRREAAAAPRALPAPAAEPNVIEGRFRDVTPRGPIAARAGPQPKALPSPDSADPAGEVRAGADGVRKATYAESDEARQQREQADALRGTPTGIKAPVSEIRNPATGEPWTNILAAKAALRKRADSAEFEVQRIAKGKFVLTRKTTEAANAAQAPADSRLAPQGVPAQRGVADGNAADGRRDGGVAGGRGADAAGAGAGVPTPVPVGVGQPEQAPTLTSAPAELVSAEQPASAFESNSAPGALDAVASADGAATGNTRQPAANTPQANPDTPQLDRDTPQAGSADVRRPDGAAFPNKLAAGAARAKAGQKETHTIEPAVGGGFVLRPKAAPEIQSQQAGNAAPAEAEQAGAEESASAPAQADGDWAKFDDQSGTLGIPRADMPQVKAEHRGAMVNFLNARGIEHEQDEVDPATLKPTQAEFSPSKVQKAKDFAEGDRSILVSADGHIVDGHHQWLAKRDAGEPVKVIRLKAPVRDLLPLVREFPSSEQAAGAKPAQQAAPEANAQADAPAEATPEQAAESTTPPDKTPVQKKQHAREIQREAYAFAVSMDDVQKATANRQLFDAVLRGAMKDWNRRESVEAATGSDQDRARALISATATLESAEFADSVFKEASKRFKEAQRDAGRDPAIYQAKLAEVMAAASLPEGAQDEFKRGFDHALAGRTKSTITGDQAQAGYKAARDWIGTDEGRAFYEGKRTKKLENTGADLRRWFDKAKADIDAADGNWEAVWRALEKLTTRAEVFRPDLAGATPGTRRMADMLRERVKPFKKWLDDSGTLNVYRGEKFDEAIKRAMRNEDVRPERLKTLKEAASSYIEAMRGLSEALSGAKSVDELAAKVQETFYDEAPKSRYVWFGERAKPYSKYIEGHEFFEFTTAGAKSEFYGGLIARLKRDENTETSSEGGVTPLRRPRLDSISRAGRKDWRAGKDVTPQQFKEAFGFADVGFGKWVNAKADQDHLNYAYDAFMDLADVLGLPPSAMGLGGRLHFTIGALGQGKHAAHYADKQPHPAGGTVPVINVTNTKGDGTVAHEWFHALDYALRGNASYRESVGRVVEALKAEYRTQSLEQVPELFLRRSSYYERTGISKTDRVGQARYAIDNGSYGRAQTTEFKRNADELGEDYWGNNEELFARAGEAWVYDKLAGKPSDYLVTNWVGDGVTSKPTFRGTPYPAGAERERFARYFEALFEGLKADDKGRISYSGEAVNALANAELSAFNDYKRQLRERLPELYREIRAAATKPDTRRDDDADKLIEDQRRREQARLESEAAVQQRPATVTSDGALSEDELGALFDQAAIQLREAQQEQPATPTPGAAAVESDPKAESAGALIKEAARLGVQGIDEALTGLAKLFGGAATLRSFPSGIDPDTYAKAKPHFEAALKSFQAAGKTISDLFKFLIQNFGEGVKPYAIQFAREQGLGRDLAAQPAQAQNPAAEASNVPDSQESQADDRNGDAGSVATDVRAPEGERGAAGGGAGAGGRRAGVVPGRSERAAEGRGDAPPASVTDGSDGRADDAAEGSRGDSARPGARVPERKRDGRNYLAPVGSLSREGSWRATATRNLDVVELVKQLQAEGRQATPEEQAKLVKFTGWGASEIAQNKAEIERLTNRIGGQFQYQADLFEKVAEAARLKAELAASATQASESAAEAQSDDDVADFRLAPLLAKSQAMPRDQLDMLVRNVLRSWDKAPPVVVVDSMTDPATPESARRHYVQQTLRGATGAPRAFILRGTVYLVADQIATPKAAVEALFHESLGHYGLRRTFGKELSSILSEIAMLRRADVDAKVRSYGFDPKSQADRLRAAEEVLAEMAQTRPEIGFVRRAIAAIRTFLRKRGLALPFSDDELIRNFILPARAYVEAGVVRPEAPDSQAAGRRQPAFSLSESDTDAEFLASYLAELAGVDALFKYPKSTADTLAGALTEIDPTIRVRGQEVVEKDERAVGAIKKHKFTNGSGQTFFVFESADNRVWIDVSRFWEGSGGNAIYAAVGDYAANTGKVFVGDPQGLSTAATIRRTYNMLASALKHGTTKHLGAAREQVRGNPFAGIPPLLWEGGDVEKVKALADTLVAYADRNVPELAGIEYDFAQRRFVRAGGTGAPDSVVDVREVVGRARDAKAKIGGRSLRASIFLASLLRSASSQRPGLLEQALREPGELVSQGGLEAMFSLVDEKSASVMQDIRDRVAGFNDSAKTFNGWWHKTVGTQYHKAQIDADYKRVFDRTQQYLTDVSRYALGAADLAQEILPRFENVGDLAKSGASPRDLKPVASAIFQGTLNYVRDEDTGRPRLAGEEESGGIVFSAAELRELFGLNEKQVRLYQQARAAIRRSLEDLAITDMVKVVRSEIDEATARRAALATSPAAARAILAEKVKESSLPLLDERVGRTAKLIADGYAPLMRFGRYSVYVTDPAGGEALYYGMFEDEADARRVEREMRAQYPKATVQRGVVSEESYTMFQGMSPDTIELFAEVTGMGQNEAFQQYLKLAKNNRSALKRLIQRKGIEGYNPDMKRVLAQFVTSNGRAASGNLHLGELTKAWADIPKEKGDVKDEAAKLIGYMQNPQEEAAKLRGLLFFNFIGGSVASAMVNMTQPLTMTLPYLSQWGVSKAAGEMARAIRVGFGQPKDADLRAAMDRAHREGVVEPHQIFELQGAALRSEGDWGKADKLRELGRKGLFLWGRLFSLAESFNRRTTFAAAYRIGKGLDAEQLAAAGVGNAYDFAVKAVNETQGIYNRGNRPDWARGAVGATLFTFKQYSISYMEFLKRLPRRERLLALGMLVLAAGINGLPGADDLDDLIDTLAQQLGYAWSTKAERNKLIERAVMPLFGQAGADFVQNGVSAVLPIDVQARMGLANLIPGTGLALKSNPDKTREFEEAIGPVAGFASGIVRAAGKVLTADSLGGAIGGALAAGPVTAIRNVFKAYDMQQMGFYRDEKGRRVIDTDGADALAKLIGFQPSTVAVETRKLETERQDIDLARAVESEIADKWAQGIFEKNTEKVAAAREQLRRWNARNPETPIRIGLPQIGRRVKEMRMTRAQRFIKAAPKELRGATVEALQP